MTDRRLARLPPAQWPSPEEAARARWFSPVKLGPVQAETRTWVPAMVPWRATVEGEVTDAVVDWYARFAKGQPGVLVVEATGIRDVPSGPLLRASDDRFVDGLSRIVKAVHTASEGHTRVFIQLIDFLSIKRRPPREKFLASHLVVTAAHRQRLGLSHGSDDEVRAGLIALPDEQLFALLAPREVEALRFGLRERVTDTQLEHIAQLPRVLPGLFARAAARCLRAGFDGVELHFAHAYTMASFLSRLNVRTDGYGLSLPGRAHLPLEVFRAVQDVVGRRGAVGCRMLAEEAIEGGSTREDAAFFAEAFAREGMDFISLSRGGKFEDAKQPRVGEAAYPYTGPSGHECMPTATMAAPGPWGRNVEATAFIKQHLLAAGLATPVVACGGIATFAQAEAVLAQGAADVVASARQALADPDWFAKVRAGRGAEVRRCFFTNYCEGLDQAHKAVTCQRWDRERGHGDDATVARTHDGRRLTAP